MVYNPATDFLGLWRTTGGTATKSEMPGLDYMLAALARAGIINLTVAATQPLANQSTTAWLRTAVPSYSAEGAFFLWDKVTSAYLAATPALFLQFLEATAGENGTSWWTSTGGPPLNTVGNDGDFAIRDDTPYGIYGPKAAGAWPADPIPGTADVITSASLDETFGTAEGSLIVRGPAVWQAVPIGAADSLFVSNGTLPGWSLLSALMDSVFGTTQGATLFRDAAGWNDLPPGAAGEVLSTNGPGANPDWTPRTPEFDSGVSLLFWMAAAPVGWTKQVGIDDYGLRVVSGAGGSSIAGSAFSTVFAQNSVGDHALSIAEMPSHNHTDTGTVLSGLASDITPGSVQGAANGATTGFTGGNAPHTHTVNLTLAYTDVIIATKD